MVQMRESLLRAFDQNRKISARFGASFKKDRLPSRTKLDKITEKRPLVLYSRFHIDMAPNSDYL